MNVNQILIHFMDDNLLTLSAVGAVHRKVNLRNDRNEIVFDSLWYPLSILLLAAIGAKLIGPHGGLQVDKQSLSSNGLRGITQ